jgi:hypothetical protein
MKERVTEYVIVPPECGEFDSPAILEQMRVSLAHAFPSWSFTVTTDSPERREDEFFVTPKGTLTDTATMGRIAEVLAPFYRGKRRLN